MREPRRVVFDTESSVIVPSPGMNAQKGARDVVLIDLGVVEMMGNRMTGREMRWRFRPSLPGHFDRYSVATHGVLPEELGGFPTFRETYQEIVSFLEDSVLFGHGVKSDMLVINAELARAGLSEMGRDRFFDTVPLVRKAFPGESPGLDAVSSRLFGAAEREVHGALSDAVLLGMVLQEICPSSDRDLQKVMSGVMRAPAPQPESLSPSF